MSNRIDSATMRELKTINDKIMETKKILNDLIDQLGIDLGETNDGLMETYDLTATNSDQLSECRSALEEIYKIITEEDNKMSAMSRIFATSCELDGRNFYTVSERLQNDVRELIENDNYVIDEDGSVVPREENED